MSESGAIRAGKAFLELTMKTLGLDKGLKAASQKLMAFGKTVAVAGAAAIGATVAAAAGAAAVFANMGSALFDASKRTGLSVESLSRLKYAADQSGVSMEGLETGVKQMQKALTNSPGEFKKLGLSVSDLQKMTPEEQFFKVAQAISEISNPSQRAAMAMKVFGKAGTSLLPMLDGGAEAMGKMADRADDLGIVMSSKDAAAADTFGDLMGDLWQQIQMAVFHIGKLIAVPLIPWAEKATEVFGRILNEAKWIAQWDVILAYSEIIWENIKWSINESIDAISKYLVESFYKAWAGIQKLGVGAVAVWETVVTNLGDSIVKAWVNAWTAIQKVWTSGFAWYESMIKDIGDTLAGLGKSQEDKDYIADMRKKEDAAANEATKAKLDALNRERDAALKNIDEINKADKQKRDQEVADKLKAIDAERDAALKTIGDIDAKKRQQTEEELERKLQGARDRIAEAEINARVESALDEFFGGVEEKAAAGDVDEDLVKQAKDTAKKSGIPSAGLFNIAAGAALRGGGAVEVGVTETAKNTKKLVELAKRGGLTFAV